MGLLTLMYGLRRDGKYACGAGGLAASLPRQVGKTFTFGTAAFLDCLLTTGLKVLWTAHRSRTSDETFASMQTLAHDAKLARYVATIRRANGQQEIGFHNGSRILFGAREQGFGRGFDGIDQIVFDEAQILTERALDDMVPATNTAANPLIVMIGTPPKPGDPAEIFRDKRRTALAGADKDLLYVEFSAPRGSDLDDREAWTAANPSYPQRTSETAIARMRAMLSDDSFRREALGIWDKTDIAHAIDPQQWEQAGVSERRDGGAVSFAVDMPPD
ncbi:MAG: terminase family protein, partial [Bifidobacterium choerinum]